MDGAAAPRTARARSPPARAAPPRHRHPPPPKALGLRPKSVAPARGMSQAELDAALRQQQQATGEAGGRGDGDRGHGLGFHGCGRRGRGAKGARGFG
jgi:hypothetical protein